MTTFRHPGEGRDPDRTEKLDPGLRRGDGEGEEGFTLVELMVVLVILALLATIFIVNVMPALERATAETTRITIRELDSAVKMYRLDNGRYPTTEEGLQALVAEGQLDRLPNDPWNHPYRYSVPGGNGRSFTITSWGADGREGGSGENADITN